LSRHATLGGSGFSLQITVDRYEFDEFDNWHDGDWVVGQVAVEMASGDRFSARVGITVLTRELADFASGLRRIVDDRSGAAELVHLESQIGITVKLDHGKGSIEGFVAKRPVAELEFAGVETDASFLVAATRDLEAIAREFPIRDSPD
jgi:hypothetical protein